MYVIVVGQNMILTITIGIGVLFMLAPKIDLSVQNP
jgi:hypothetical protein